MDASDLCRLLRLPQSEWRAYSQLFEALTERDKKRQAEPSDDIQADVTAERMKMAGGQVESFVTDTGRRTARMLDGSLLDAMMARGRINGDQYAAGSQFHHDWYMGGLASSGVVDTTRERVDGGQHKQASDIKLDALGRFVRALKAIGRHHAEALLALICFEVRRDDYIRGLTGISSAQSANVAAETILLLALSALVDHYMGPRRHGKRRA